MELSERKDDNVTVLEVVGRVDSVTAPDLGAKLTSILSAPPRRVLIDFGKLDKTIHEKGRLSIMTLLATRSSWSFQDLKSQLAMSDGNLITHLRVLHEAGHVAMIKEVLDRPQTSYALTERGKTAFQEYLAVLEQIVKAVQQ